MNQRLSSPTPFRAAGLLARVRPLVAVALAQLMIFGLAPLGRGVAHAQTNAKAAAVKRPNWTHEKAGGVFIVQQGEDGTVCRVAMPGEALRLRTSREGMELRQINHLDDRRIDANGMLAAEDGTAAAEANMTIILRATTQLDANPTAKAAFIAAAAKWEAIVKDPITVIIDVDFGTTAFGEAFPSDNTLGVTSSQGLFFDNNYTSLRQRLINRAENASESAIYNALPSSTVPTDLGNVSTVVVQSPNLRALGLIGPDARNDGTTVPGDPPAVAFNSAFGFDFDPSNGIQANQTDFDAVAVHEIGHVLGFDSNVGLREVAPTAPLHLALWDLFRFRPGTGSVNFTNSNRILTTGGTQVHFDGNPELQLSTGNPNGENGDGNQASHWKDSQGIGIMDPTIARGQRLVLTANDIRATNFFGYQMGAGPAAPANDNFSSAQVISGSTGQIAGTNNGATKEAGEPNHGDNTGGRSVWYRWTAPGSGQATFTTIGSNYDTTLAAYTGPSVGSLTRHASNDDIVLGEDIQSRIQFTVTAGTTYHIAVDGYDADIGNIVLNWSAPAGPTPTPTPTPSPTPNPGGPNTVQFQVTSQGASETATSIHVNVTRTGDLSGAASVRYATANGSASDRSDYMAAIGTLRFAANESSKTIRVFFVNDRYQEPAENFTISLSSPSGCTLGAATTTTVGITSDDTVNGSSPVKATSFNAAFFVRQHYLDFLNREPDAAGLAFWSAQTTSCGNPDLEVCRVNVSASFFLSREFQETGYLVYLTHQAAFNTRHTLGYRAFLADAAQVGNGFVDLAPGADTILEANKVAFFNEFVNRAAFVATYPSAMTPAQFVNTLANNAGTSISQAERDALTNALAAGSMTRARVLRSIVEDNDFESLHRNRAFVLMQYFGYFRRAPNDPPNTDFSGYSFWLGKLEEFNGNFVNAEMVKAFITSGEYIDRFGQP